MYLAYIPIMLACVVLYCASDKQLLLRNSLPRRASLLISSILLLLAIYMISASFPLISSVIASVGLVCCLLPLVTISSAYGKKVTFAVVSGLAVCSAALTLIEGVI